MASESFAKRLGRQARPLRPARPPFYMSAAMPPRMPASGWYMQPNAGPVIYLGFSYEAALRTLDALAGAPALVAA